MSKFFHSTPNNSTFRLQNTIQTPWKTIIQFYNKFEKYLIPNSVHSFLSICPSQCCLFASLHIFYDAEIRRKSRPFQDFNAVCSQIWRHTISFMHRAVILLKHEVFTKFSKPTSKAVRAFSGRSMISFPENWAIDCQKKTCSRVHLLVGKHRLFQRSGASFKTKLNSS